MSWLWLAVAALPAIGAPLVLGGSTTAVLATVLALLVGLSPIASLVSRRLVAFAEENGAPPRRHRRLGRTEPPRMPLRSQGLGAEWQRLTSAHRLVDGLAAEGWIERRALDSVQGHVERLERLLAADRGTDTLGGQSSATLRQQVEELTGLLVALADAAIERQAVLEAGDPTPATLRDAHERLGAERQAYSELTGWPSACLEAMQERLERRPPCLPGESPAE